MDASVFYCPGCGQPVDVDFKTRKGHCEWCGNSVTFPRKTFNRDDKVKNELTLCTRYFYEKRFADAKAHAENVLAVAIDNAPALYVRAYYEAFSAVNKNSGRIGEFFQQIDGIDTDNEEVEELKKMFISTLYKLEFYEETILQWALKNLDGEELREFTDSFSPILIGNRSSINFFTPQLEELYKEICAKCSIPKTCYALLQAISTNPDSPYPNNSFFLRTKTQRFYQDFVLPIGEIIQNMNSQELRTRFYSVYQTNIKNFKEKMIGGTD